MKKEPKFKIGELVLISDLSKEYFSKDVIKFSNKFATISSMDEYRQYIKYDPSLDTYVYAYTLFDYSNNTISLYEKDLIKLK